MRKAQGSSQAGVGSSPVAVGEAVSSSRLEATGRGRDRVLASKGPGSSRPEPVKVRAAGRAAAQR